MKKAHARFAGAALAVATAFTFATAANAADLLKPADPIYSSQLFNFEGLYAGVQGGGALDGSVSGVLGVVVGANFAVSDGILAGVEFQGDSFWTGGGLSNIGALGLGRVGGYLSDNTVLFGDIGGGAIGGTAVYAVGAGVEMALTEQFSVRGDAQVLGAWGGMPSAFKATAGLVYHFN